MRNRFRYNSLETPSDACAVRTYNFESSDLLNIQRSHVKVNPSYIASPAMENALIRFTVVVIECMSFEYQIQATQLTIICIGMDLTIAKQLTGFLLSLSSFFFKYSRRVGLLCCIV